MAWLESPFCALPVAVDLDDGGVDHGVFHVGIVGDGVEEPFENVGPDPVAEPREHAVPIAEFGRQVTLGQPRPGAANGCDRI